MKKTLSLLVALIMLVSGASLAGEDVSGALDAFYSLISTQPQPDVTDLSVDDYLAMVIEGAFAAAPSDAQAAAVIAPALGPLTGISDRDIAAYAAHNNLSVGLVRNAYYRSLANVLRAELMLNPASEENYRNVQIILSLFLAGETDDNIAAARTQIRENMTAQHAQTIASSAMLPPSFVEFIIMNGDWDDDDWHNDDDWREAAGWTDAHAVTLSRGSADTASTTDVARLQARLIALGYMTAKADGVFGNKTLNALIQFQRANGLPVTGVYDADDSARIYSSDAVARWDYQDSFDDSPDDDIVTAWGASPDDDSPDVDDSPDADNSPDYDNSPDIDNSPDYDNSPDIDNSPDYDNSPDIDNSPDYDNSPDVDNSPDYDNSPDVDNSPDYDNSPDGDDSPDWDDT